KRRLNVKLLFVLLGALLCLGVGVHFLHGYQVTRQARGLVTQADRAEKERDYRLAIDYLRRYLGFQPNNTEVLVRYGRLLARDDIATTRSARFQAINILESALTREAERQEERILLIDLLLAQQEYKQAEYHLDMLTKKGTENQKLLGKLAKCQEALNRF